MNIDRGSVAFLILLANLPSEISEPARCSRPAVLGRIRSVSDALAELKRGGHLQSGAASAAPERGAWGFRAHWTQTPLEVPRDLKWHLSLERSSSKGEVNPVTPQNLQCLWRLFTRAQPSNVQPVPVSGFSIGGANKDAEAYGWFFHVYHKLGMGGDSDRESTCSFHAIRMATIGNVDSTIKHPTSNPLKLFCTIYIYIVFSGGGGGRSANSI